MFFNGQTLFSPLLKNLAFLGKFFRETTTVTMMALAWFARHSTTEWLVSEFQTKVLSYPSALTGFVHRPEPHWAAREVSEDLFLGVASGPKTRLSMRAMRLCCNCILSVCVTKCHHDWMSDGNRHGKNRNPLHHFFCPASSLHDVCVISLRLRNGGRNQTSQRSECCPRGVYYNGPCRPDDLRSRWDSPDVRGIL